MRNNFIIGISGLSGSGKNAVADMLSDDNTITIAFADKIKRDAMDVYGFTKEQLWGASELRNIPDEKYLKKGITLVPRDVLIEMGTAGRKIYKDTWVDYTERTIKTIYDNPTTWLYSNHIGLFQRHGYEKRWYSQAELVDQYTIRHAIISDLRFPNEFDMIKRNNGVTIKVKRPGAGLKIDKHKGHESEAGLADDVFDYVIDNDGTLEDLRCKVKKIEKEIKKRTIDDVVKLVIIDLDCVSKDGRLVYSYNNRPIPEIEINKSIKYCANKLGFDYMIDFMEVRYKLRQNKINSFDIVYEGKLK